MATSDALSVFFIVATSARHINGNNRNVSMVALVGQPFGWPVPIEAGIPTPASVTTPLECRNSGGDSVNSMEATTVATIPTQNHPKYQYRFMALSRSDMNAEPCRLSIEAYTEKEARRILAPQYILFFAARLPVQEVSHV